MLHWVLIESGIPIYCMAVQQIFYLEHKTSNFKKHTEAFDNVMDNTFNAQPYDKPKDVVDEDTKYALDLDYEDKAFEADFN